MGISFTLRSYDLRPSSTIFLWSAIDILLRSPEGTPRRPVQLCAAWVHGYRHFVDGEVKQLRFQAHDTFLDESKNVSQELTLTGTKSHVTIDELLLV